jgi:hypothetical protein
MKEIVPDRRGVGWISINENWGKGLALLSRSQGVVLVKCSNHITYYVTMLSFLLEDSVKVPNFGLAGNSSSEQAATGANVGF